MDSDQYLRMLQGASPEEVRQILIDDLACPIDWTTAGTGDATSIFLQRWFYDVADALPNGELDAGVLKGDLEEYLAVPGDESFDWSNLDDEEALSLAFNTVRHREHYRSHYENDCRRFVGLRAQSAQDRPKHYPLGAKTLAEVKARSERKTNVGFLLPNLSPAVQVHFFWSSAASYFGNRTAELEEAGRNSDREIFDSVWNEFLGLHQFRLSVDAMGTVGYYNGKPARWLIYDVSFDSQISHCYPSLEAEGDSFITKRR